jgi:hypothetical protein
MNDRNILSTNNLRVMRKHAPTCDSACTDLDHLSHDQHRRPRPQRLASLCKLGLVVLMILTMGHACGDGVHNGRPTMVTSIAAWKGPYGCLVLDTKPSAHEPCLADPLHHLDTFTCQRNTTAICSNRTDQTLKWDPPLTSPTRPGHNAHPERYHAPARLAKTHGKHMRVPINGIGQEPRPLSRGRTAGPPHRTAEPPSHAITSANNVTNRGHRETLTEQHDSRSRDT